MSPTRTTPRRPAERAEEVQATSTGGAQAAPRRERARVVVMVKRLLSRELRRQLPYGLGGLVLGGLLAQLAGGDGETLAVAWAGIVPLLVGLSAFAPDTSSGSTAFLSRLPLPPARLFATKVAAGLFSLLPLALALSLGVGSVPSRLLLPLGCGAYGAGLLASATAARVMPALLLGPILLATSALCGVGLSQALWRVPWVHFTGVGAPLLSGYMALAGVGWGLLSLLLAGLVVGWGDRHRASPRPAVIAAAGLTVGLLVQLGGTAAAWGWTQGRLEQELQAGPGLVTAGPGGWAAVELHARLWSGLERRVALAQAGAPLRPLALRGAAAPSFSPDGHWLLVSDAAEPGGWRVELASGAATRLPGLAEEGFGFPGVLWDGAPTPLLVRQVGTAVQVFRPVPDGGLPPARYQAAWQLGAGERWVGVRGDRLLIADARGVRAVPPPPVDPARGPSGGADRGGGAAPPRPLGPAPEGERLVNWVGAPLDALASPDGRRLLARRGEGARSLSAWDLASGLEVTLAWDRLAEGAGLDLSPEAVSFAPDGRSVAVETRQRDLAVFDLGDGRLRFQQLRKERGMSWDRVLSWAYLGAHGGGPVSWSPDGRRLATADGLRLQLTDGAARAVAGTPTAGYLDDERLVPLDAPLLSEGGEGAQ